MSTSEIILPLPSPVADLPEGWTEASFMDVFDIQGGTQPAKTNFIYEPRRGYVRLLQIRDFGAKPLPTYIPSNGPLKTCVSEDILIGRYGASVGRICTGFEGAYNVALTKVVIPPSLYRRFVFWVLQSEWFQKPILEIERSAQNGFNKGNLERIAIPLCPEPEQRRIVSRIDQLFQSVNAARERLAHVQVILERFRQAVLAAACSGRLTAEWREKAKRNSGKGDELPAGWKWTAVEELLPKGGIFDGPFGSNLKTVDYTKSGVQVIRMENIGRLRFYDEKKTYISQQKYEALKKHTVSEGDVIFASFIDDEIRACVLPRLHTKAIAKADCFCLRPHTNVDRRFFAFQLVDRESQDRLLESVHGATRPRINTTQLRKLEVRWCPFDEQREIVNRVEALFRLADAIEKRIGVAMAVTKQLTQAILAKAFRGELIPTEAELARREGRSYESAADLLARIRASRVHGNGKNGRETRRVGEIHSRR